MRPKPKVARAVRPNQGLRMMYQRALMRMITDMASSVEYWLKAQRRGDPPELAQDETPAEKMKRELRKLSERWQGRFDDMAPKVAESFLKNQFKGTDAAMRMALRDAGWSVEFTMTPAMRDAFEASLAENVGLIKSIPSQYLQEVEGIVMRNYAAGRDLKSMAAEIRERYAVAANRAVLIARDQSNKCSAVVQRARQIEIGIKQSIWMHSHAGKEPRRSHMAMNGKIYEVDKGMYDPDVKDFIFPGQLINCRCVGRSVLPWTPAEKPATSASTRSGK
jgi:SPP1 gp7 family putative phage head morphogenesis protein